MSFPLYYNQGKYYLIIQKGNAWNIGYEFGSFQTRFIGNEDLSNMEEIELNSANIKILFNNIKKFENINFDNFDHNMNHYFIYNNQIYYIENWQHVFNFANGQN